MYGLSFTDAEYDAYLKVNHIFHVEDAKWRVAEYFDWVKDTDKIPDNIDYDYLAREFEDRINCDTTEDSLWNYLIKEYIEEELA